MAKIEDLIAQIPDERLRKGIAAEVKALKKTKKFGLVFEEHLPEMVHLPNIPVKPGELVAHKHESGNQLWRVKTIHKNVATCIRAVEGYPPSIEPKQEFTVSNLVVVRSFGEPIYPALVPVDRVERGGPDKPWHVLINADNFHALQLLLYCYESKVDMIYIDPPYNTGARDWKYNNDYVDKTDSFRHSKWLSMLKKRLTFAKRLLKPDGVLVVTIDDHELGHLMCLLEDLFQGFKFFTIVIEHNKRGRQGEEFARSHEYALFVVPQGEDIIGEEPLESTIGGETRNLRRTGNNSLRAARPGQFYPIYVNERTLEVTGFGEPLPKLGQRKETKVGSSIPIWPLDKQGVERNWHYGPKRAKKEL